MADTFFKRFKTVSYGNNNVIDISERVVLLNSVQNNPFVYYPYDVKEGERPDHIAERYYNDPHLGWLLWFSNGIIDPYYQWFMDQEQWQTHVIDKWGSVEYAQRYVLYYRNNYYDSDETMTVSAYDDLPGYTRSYVNANNDTVNINDSLKKFWEPVYGQANRILEYKRKQLDDVVSTNEVVSYAYTGNNAFIKNEVVDIHIQTGSVGHGQVVYSNSSVLYLQHMSGDYLTSNTVVINGNSHITGVVSAANVVIASANSVTKVIPPDEAVYYSPVYAFDAEYDINTNNKTVKVLKDVYVNQTLQQMNSLLRQ